MMKTVSTQTDQLLCYHYNPDYYCHEKETRCIDPYVRVNLDGIHDQGVFIVRNFEKTANRAERKWKTLQNVVKANAMFAKRSRKQGSGDVNYIDVTDPAQSGLYTRNLTLQNEFEPVKLFGGSYIHEDKDITVVHLDNKPKKSRSFKEKKKRKSKSSKKKKPRQKEKTGSPTILVEHDHPLKMQEFSVKNAEVKPRSPTPEESPMLIHGERSTRNGYHSRERVSQVATEEQITVVTRKRQSVSSIATEKLQQWRVSQETSRKEEYLTAFALVPGSEERLSQRGVKGRLIQASDSPLYSPTIHQNNQCKNVTPTILSQDERSPKQRELFIASSKVADSLSTLIRRSISFDDAGNQFVTSSPLSSPKIDDVSTYV